MVPLLYSSTHSLPPSVEPGSYKNSLSRTTAPPAVSQTMTGLDAPGEGALLTAKSAPDWLVSCPSATRALLSPLPGTGANEVVTLPSSSIQPSALVSASP